MSRGIIGMLQLAASMAFAIPVAIFGVLNLADGKPLLGVVFLGLAVGMVAVEEFVTSPMDIPAQIAERVAGRVVKDPDEDQ